MKLQNLVQKIKEKEESDRKAKETELDLTKLQIYFNNPKSQRLASARVYRPSYTPFEEILEEAYKKLNIKLFAPIERCRLVAFDHDSHQIERSLDDCNAEEVYYKIILFFIQYLFKYHHVFVGGNCYECPTKCHRIVT